MLTLNFKRYEDQLVLQCNFCVLKHCVYRIMYVLICSWKNKHITKKKETDE